jgi:hypothetical protein
LRIAFKPFLLRDARPIQGDRRVKGRSRRRVLVFSAAASALILAPGWAGAASESSDIGSQLAVEPLQWDVGDYQIRLGLDAGGALFTSDQSGGPAFPDHNVNRASAVASGNVRIQRILDNGMVLGLGGDFLLYHDEFSGDLYGNDFIEKLFVSAQTGFGRFELGQVDGAAYTLGLVGPLTNAYVTLANRNISLFRDPVTGEHFARFFASIAAVQSSSNYAKINYISPRLFGVQIGASFTPQVVRSPLPFTGNPTSDPDQQQSIWEVAANYTGYFSDVAVGFSAGYAGGSLKNRTTGSDDLYDWALGAQFAYMLSDVRLSLGGGYRESNAYLLETGSVLAHGGSRVTHVSATAEWRNWIAGVEYSLGNISGPVGYDVTGYQVSAGYKINDNLQLTGGWQWYTYDRNLGAFYNGSPSIDMNAGFLLLTFQL